MKKLAMLRPISIRKLESTLAAVAAAFFFLSSASRAADETAKSPESSGETAKVSDKSENVTSKMMFVYLEMVTLGHSYPDDSDEIRLGRMEQLVFGKVQDGKTDQRLSNLMSKVSGSSNTGDGHHLKGGVSMSNLDIEQRRIGQDGGVGRAAGSRSRANDAALRVEFSLGGSKIENSFNGQSQLDAFVSQYIKYVGGLLENQPAARRMRVHLTMSEPGISGGFSGGTVSVAPRAAAGAAAFSTRLIGPSSGSEAYGRIATAGFVQSWSASSRPVLSAESSGSVADNSPVHFAPLIIQISVGGSHVANSFNSENQSNNLLDAQGGRLDVVPSARPYILSVAMGASNLVKSFGAPADQAIDTQIKAFAVSKDLQQKDFISVKGQRPLILHISAGGSDINNCFNKTGGIVRLANEIADGLESSVRPEILNSLSQIHLAKGGCKIVDSYSTK